MKRVALLAGLLLVTSIGLVFLFPKQSRTALRQSAPPGATPSAAAASAGLVGTPTGRGSSSRVVTSTNPPATLSAREFDLAVNPYAGALREPGKSKRTWDTGFLGTLSGANAGDPIQFELTEGRMASGTVRITQFTGSELTYVSGVLEQPENGKFFFLKPPVDGRAGKAIGIVEFPASRTAYRIEPTGPNGGPELWQRRLDEVVCTDMPQPQSASGETATNEVANMPPLRPDNVADFVPSYNSNIVSLQSYPGSSAVLLLDFFGGYTPTWGGIAYSRPAGINNSTIRDLWKRVAEDYMCFNINVTTDLKVYLAAPASSRQRCCFTDTKVTAAGVAYIGSWNWGNDTPCWSVYTTGKNGAEVGAHEPGHTLGLGHQGSYNTDGTVNDYYLGQGSGPTGWAPIMGAGYYQPVSSWAKGEYANANNHQDELAVMITYNNVRYRPDDTGSTLATSRYLEVYPDNSVYAEGVIERTDDTDAFQFTTSGGQVSLTARPVGDWADLGLMATLADSTDTVIASDDPQNVLTASINTTLAPGTYTFRVTGVGRNDPLVNGFTSYASLGYYSIAGWVEGAVQPTRLSVVEHSPNGFLVGTVPANSTTNALAYAIISGNTGSTFALDNTGALQVANNALLDYNRMATNTMFPVQFELLVNITNLDDDTLTELNRRVVVEVRKAGANYPLTVTGLNAGLIVPFDATPAAPHATAFDIANNYCFYAAGLNGNAQVGGTGGMQGLPPGGRLVSAADGTTFQLGPYGNTNALLLGYTYPSTATVTLSTPQAFNSLSILASSANGGGVGFFYLRFTNGTTSQAFRFNAQDWYNTITNVAVQGVGRLKLGQTTLSTENPGWNNPNLYSTTVDLAGLGLNIPVASIIFSKPAGGSTMSTAVFAISGAVMPDAVNITRQPVSTTNVVPANGASFSVAAMGAAPLGYQWLFSASGTPGTFAPLTDQTNATLSLVPPLDPTNAGAYCVVVTNSVSAATSAVATLTVFREPTIVQQPAPAALTLLAGASMTLKVGATGAVPLSYYWQTNGANLPGANASLYTDSSVQPTDGANYSVVVSNAYGSVTSSIVALTVVPAPSYYYGQRVMADRPISYWRLDELSGATAYDCIGGRNGTYRNVLLGQTGDRLVDTHRSARFGYLASNNSLVTNVPIDFATTTSTSFSIEAWVNGAAQTSDAGLVTRGSGGGGEQFNLDCGGGNHGFRFFVRDSTGATHLGSSSTALDGKWHHVVGVCDQTHSNVFLYVDGTNAASAPIVPGSGILAASTPMSIGSRKSGANTAYDLQFVGYMEEMAVYNYALSPAQVQAHFSVVTNRPPVFALNPITLADANAGQVYAATLAGDAADPNGDAFTYVKVSGPTWMSLASGGAISGTPLSPDAGTNTIAIRATDSAGASSTATVYVNVIPAPDLNATLALQGQNLNLNWAGGVGPYQVEMTADLANPNWQAVASSLTGTNLVLTPTNGAAFYRVVGQ